MTVTKISLGLALAAGLCLSLLYELNVSSPESDVFSAILLTAFFVCVWVGVQLHLQDEQEINQIRHQVD